MKPVLKPRPPPLAKLPDLERETWTTEPRREHLASPADFPRPGHRAAASLSAEDTEEHGSEDDTTAPKIHAYTSERTSTQQQRRGRLLRKRAPRPRLCASNRINGCQVPDCRAGLTLAGPLGTTMQQHGLAGLESSHCHWFPNLQREIAQHRQIKE